MKKISTTIACAVLLLTSVSAQVPQIINYQGRVIAGGTNFTGTGLFKFALVNSTGSTSFWSNDGTSAAGSQPGAAVSLSVTQGLYSVLLGDTTIANMPVALPVTVFTNSNVLLRVWFSDGVSGFQQFAPDQRVGAIGYALVAASHDPTRDVQGRRLNIGTAHMLTGNLATIGGGNQNIATASAASIGGGEANTANSIYTTVGGGFANTSGGNYATVAGGAGNVANGQFASIGGGDGNQAAGGYSTVGGGLRNAATGFGATVGGGGFDGVTVAGNIASGNGATIGGGMTNIASGVRATIGGGFNNTSSHTNTTVGGGDRNSASSAAATVGGGTRNKAMNFAATVGGGVLNIANGDFATVGGGESNYASGDWTTTCGGFVNVASGRFSTVGGGFENVTTGQYGTVGGGHDNSAGGESATVGGGEFSSATGAGATVGGGINNSAHGYGSTVAGGDRNFAFAGASTVGGGEQNSATNAWATVPGGYLNTAGGTYSFAAGQRAKAIHAGAFVWADSQNAAFSSTSSNQFLIRAAGGVGISSNTVVEIGFGVAGKEGNAGKIGYQLFTTNALDIVGAGSLSNNRRIKLWCEGGLTTTGPIDVNGTVCCSSDRNAKENFAPVNAREVLEKVADLPIATWKFKQGDDARHIGPVAQDFYEKFGVGTNDKHIATVDADGVALAAIQGLHQIVRDLQNEVAELRSQLRELHLSQILKGEVP